MLRQQKARLLMLAIYFEFTGKNLPKSLHIRKIHSHTWYTFIYIREHAASKQALVLFVIPPQQSKPHFQVMPSRRCCFHISCPEGYHLRSLPQPKLQIHQNRRMGTPQKMLVSETCFNQKYKANLPTKYTISTFVLS